MGRVVSYATFKRARNFQRAHRAGARHLADVGPLEIGSLIFRCPKTGREFDSGINMDRQTFIMTALSSVVVFCRCCEQLYQWNVGDGTIVPFADVRQQTKNTGIPVVVSPKEKMLASSSHWRTATQRRKGRHPHH